MYYKIKRKELINEGAEDRVKESETLQQNSTNEREKGALIRSKIQWCEEGAKSNKFCF